MSKLQVTPLDNGFNIKGSSLFISKADDIHGVLLKQKKEHFWERHWAFPTFLCVTSEIGAAASHGFPFVAQIHKRIYPGVAKSNSPE